MTLTIAEYYAEQGAARVARKHLRIALESKFGALSEAVIAKINAIKDLEVFDRLFQQAVKVEKLDELQF